MKKLAVLLPILMFAGSAFANINPHWIRNVDVNGDKSPDVIATTNLFDIAFNQQGEVVGWFVKPVKGTSTITEKNGVVNASRLNNAPNLLQVRNQNGKDKIWGKAFAIPLEGTVTAEDAVLNPRPGVEVKGESTDTLTAVFKYTQGDATVTKTFTIHARKYTIDAKINVEGASNYQLSFEGLQNIAQPNIKGIGKNDATLVSTGEVKNVNYVSLQGGKASTQPALVVVPTGETTADGLLNPTKVALTNLNGETNLRVYGGFNEAIRLHLEGYLGLPGLFDPSFVLGNLGIYTSNFLTWMYNLVGNWGLAIILLTIIIRLAMWPLMQAQYKSMAEMQAIQPLVTEINKKYADDAQKRGQATMQLYQEHGVNPFGGCLPMFLPMPILIVLWQVFSRFEFTTGFLWLPDLALPDPYYIMVILYIGAMFLQTWVSTRKNPEMFRQQLFMFAIFIFLALQFPSGVTLYYTLFTLLGLGQQILINRQVERHMEMKKVSKA
ncbi:membrane protein insertase YidC [Deinococcus cellulosilyticus]|uniref:Membrane protein insertase YidC n=1 Tax=Deinococcus cellulosilyticus (strain DSM 18568 / NBRC 106333 / KACC 11606 / 5516J-15) TaxID=1223518 RepID=A0A511N6S8_DEIC1|nr:membrane protein insertase YidC [Deinococcus cellulosilyticus]GEM48168.1 membrane protein insertase YidC [Deinococcus cellulosilyticus NBRC 106333 = KACC 11606]